MTLKEIQARKAELKALLESEEEVNLDEIKSELDKLDEEERSLEQSATDESAVEERRNLAQQIMARSTESEVKEIKEIKEIKMERKDVLNSPAYRSAWAKKMLQYADNQFTEEEKRALGDAITTTDTEYVASTASVQGINNGGLFVPTSVRENILGIIEQNSPFFRDIQKLQVAGNIDLPFVNSADDANWYAETDCTANEGIEFASIKLTGHELAKNVVVTWKLEAMAVESFITFIQNELARKLGSALCTAILFGTGTNEPTGAVHGVTAQTNANPILAIKSAKASLSAENAIGAKAYINEALADEITFMADSNGNYPYLAGLPKIAGLTVEVEPYLVNSDGDALVVVGNPNNYVLNEVLPIRVDKERDVKCRKVYYSGYGVFDGAPKTDAFALGKVVESV